MQARRERTYLEAARLLAGRLVMLGSAGMLLPGSVALAHEPDAPGVAASGTVQETRPIHATADAEAWQCHSEIEIQCTGSGCEAQQRDSSTPIRVDIDVSASLSVCAYSGCWEGQARHVSLPPFELFIGSGLPFSTAVQNASGVEDIAISIDRSDGIATLKAGAFALPLRCARRVGSAQR